jgi:hypothetical protein
MPTTNTPAPVPVTVTPTVIPLSQIERAPAPVVDTAPPPPVIPRSQIDRSPGAVTPSTDPALTEGTTVPATPPVTEQPVDTGNAAATDNVFVNQPNYLIVNEDGNLVVERTTILNFTGSAVTVTKVGASTATVNIAGGGNADLGNWAFDANTMYNVSGGAVNNADLSSGATAQLTLPANGSTSPVSLLNYYGDIALIAGDNPGNTYGLTFSSTGEMTLPGNLSVAGNISGSILAPDGNGSVVINASGLLGSTAGFNYDTSADMLYTGGVTANGNAITGDGGFYVGVSTYHELGSTIVAQLTSNINSYSQINQQNVSNGTLASGDYIITADNGTDTTYYLDIGLSSSAHEDENFFGDTATINDGYFYVTGTDQAGPSTSGGPGNLIIGSTNGQIKLFVGNTAQANVIATVDSSGLIMTAPVIGDGNLKLQPDPNDAASYLDIYLTTGPDIHIAKTDSNVILGSDTGANVTVGSNGAVFIQANTGTAHTWTFDTTGNLILPGNSTQINYANGSPITITANTGNVTFSDQIVIGTGISNLVSGLYLAPSSSSANAVQYLRVRGDVTYEPTHIHFDTGNNQYFNQFIGDDNKYVLLSNTGNIVINTSDYGNNTAQWTFGATGGTIFPTLSTQRGDNPSGTISGQTLLFGDGSQEAIISTPDGSNASGINSQRLVINPGKGEDSNGGEGGDIYLWAGRGGNNNGSGGDVKIRGGQGMGNTGSGGYLRIEAGDSQDLGAPGYIDIRGGESANSYGGYVQVTGGQGGNGQGGPVQLLGGQGATGFKGGDANIIGGPSADGVGSYGNVNISAGGSNWRFDNTGNTTFPGNLTGSGASPAPSINGFGSVNAITFSASGNVTAANFFGNGNTLSNVATQVTGSWNVTTGTNNYSFTVLANNTYQLWVRGNIPNGIIVYNATVSVTNTNVPVIGQQFAWNYEGAGSPILFTSIPAQIIGTAGAISNANPAVGTTTNVFTFGINNSSGENVTVNYGYTKIS